MHESVKNRTRGIVGAVSKMSKNLFNKSTTESTATTLVTGAGEGEDKKEEKEKQGELNGTEGEEGGEMGAKSGAVNKTEMGDVEGERTDGIEMQEDQAEESEDESNYLTGFKLAIIMAGLAMACFVVALDNTIIATAIPTITTQFNSLNDVGWYGASYLLTTTAFQPSYGKLYKNFNVMWTFLSALFLFELGSLICAVAPDTNVLILGRAVAGVGAAGIFSGAMTIIGYSVPLRKRAMYIGIVSSTFGIASAVGPVIGGALTDHIGWRWCFWINLPVGAATVAIIFFFFKSPPRPGGKTILERLGELDTPGAFFFMGAIVQLILALQWGGFTYPWSSARIIGLFVGFGLTLIIFAAIQVMSGEKATMPVRIFLKQRTVFFASTYGAFVCVALNAHIFFLPFYFQAIHGTTATESGIRQIPYVVAITIGAIISGVAVTVVGKLKPFIVVGTLVFNIGCGLMYTFAIEFPASKWIGYQVLCGLGAGAGVQLPVVAIQVVLNNDDMPTGNALVVFMQTLGGAIGVAIAQNIFSNRLIKGVIKYAPGVDPRLVVAAGATGMRKMLAEHGLNQWLDGIKLAYMDAVKKSFIVAIAGAVMAFICACFIENVSVKGKKVSHGGG